MLEAILDFWVLLVHQNNEVRVSMGKDWIFKTFSRLRSSQAWESCSQAEAKAQMHVPCRAWKIPQYPSNKLFCINIGSLPNFRVLQIVNICHLIQCYILIVDSKRNFPYTYSVILMTRGFKTQGKRPCSPIRTYKIYIIKLV